MPVNKTGSADIRVRNIAPAMKSRSTSSTLNVIEAFIRAFALNADRDVRAPTKNFYWNKV
ncbi:MAG: hypothetical protein M3Q99_05605 [Acidobacteriota bacterium]|nr:hypothetical protein [Acidobacteriota bacterium]